MNYYRKVLSPIESQRHFVYVTNQARDMFPAIGEIFVLSVGKNEVNAKLDKQGRIWGNANSLDYQELEILLPD